jgi:lipopolysaccharide transport system ATP-binding protein
MNQTVIKIENLFKEYQLGVVTHRALYREMQTWWARIRGKDDPNSLITHNEFNKNDNELKEQFLALNDVSFEVKEGEVLGIIGRNGAGKSTLLKILSKVTAPTSGLIKIKGRVASLLEVGTGFHPELTGRENIYLNGAILGMNKQEIEKKFDEIVDFSGVEQFIDTPVKRYSSGMHVRLAFAVAAHLEPEILVVDEVLAVGDLAFQKKCLGKMKDVSTQGRTVLFVSHNMEAIQSLCGRVICLNKGKNIFDGGTDEGINFYKSISSETEGIEQLDKSYLSFPEYKDVPFQMNSLSIKNTAGDLNNYFSINDIIVVEIEYEAKKRVIDLMIGLFIYKNDELYILSYITDSNSEYESGHEKGIYKAAVKIPSLFLPNGEYLFWVHAGIANTNTSHKPDQGIKVFIHSDVPNIALKSFHPGRQAKVLLSSKWEVEKKEIGNG